MKKGRLIISLFALLLLFPDCSTISNKEKDDAKKIYTSCSPIAEMWLKEFDKNGYSYLKTLKLSDLLKTEINETDLQNYIINIEKMFGRVQKRDFIGAHFWLHNKLLTYYPNFDKKVMDRIGQTEASDGFYKINPRYMGLQKSSDMFRSFPEGNYLVMMYNSIPTNKPKAGEMVILWRDSNDTWQVVSYIIKEDI